MFNGQAIERIFSVMNAAGAAGVIRDR